MLAITECPVGKYWNAKKSQCEETLPECDPVKSWITQKEVDLEDCIGLVENICHIGFIKLEKAQKYCEGDEACVGLKQMPCNKVTDNLECIGTYWRPFKTIVSKPSDSDIYLIQRQNDATHKLDEDL